MIKTKCYCDRCQTEFESEYSSAFQISNSFALSNPSNMISGTEILKMILCPDCEEELLKWLGREDRIEKVKPKPTRGYSLKGLWIGYR